MADRIRAWGPAAAWAGVLFLLSSLSDVPGAGRIPFGDKLGHFTLYAVLGLLLAFGRRRSGQAVPHLALLAIGALYAAGDEWHQAFVPGRSPDPADWVADVVGLLTGYLALSAAGTTDATDETKGPA